MISAGSPPSLVSGNLVLKGFQKDRPILLRYSGNPMVRAAPPVGPARVRLLHGRQRDDDLRRAPWRYQDGAPTIIAHPATASKVGFTGRTPLNAPLFGGFPGTTQSSDFPQACMSGVRGQNVRGHPYISTRFGQPA
jgi:hypothetical protein